MSEKHTITFLKPWRSYFAGDVARFAANVARQLVDAGVACYTAGGASPAPAAANPQPLHADLPKAATPPEWQAHVEDQGQRRLQRCASGGSGRLMRLCDLVQWLCDALEQPQGEAVRIVCDVLEERAADVYMLSATGFAQPVGAGDSFGGVGVDAARGRGFAGLSGAINRMRFCWPQSLSCSVYEATNLDLLAIPYDLVCALFVAPAEAEQVVPEESWSERAQKAIEWPEIVAYRNAYSQTHSVGERHVPAPWTFQHLEKLAIEASKGRTHADIAGELGISKSAVTNQLSKFREGGGKRDRGRKRYGT